MLCEICHKEEVPTGDGNFYMEINHFCLHCFIYFCDSGAFWVEAGMTLEEERQANDRWLTYCEKFGNEVVRI
jgi:hypothetical protein